MEALRSSSSLKSKMREIDSVWSAPASFLSEAESGADPPRGDCGSPIDVISALCALVVHDPGDADSQQHHFFGMLEAAPERKKGVRPVHMALRSSEVSVVMYDKVTVTGHGEAEWDELSGTMRTLDLAWLCGVDKIGQLHQWPCVENLPEVAFLLQCRLPS